MAQFWQTRLTLNVILGLSDASAVFYPGKINSYKPIVSDVSDDDLVETVKQIEKSENVITHTPGLAHTMPFDVFKTTRGR